MIYRIAYLTVDWNYELVESTLHGLKQYVDEHPDVQVCVFDCFGKEVDSPKSKSEYAIFRLADLSRFDGVLLQGNQMVLNAAREEVSRRVRAAGIPAVTVDCPVEGCDLVGIDNVKAQYEITDHVLTVHGAKRLVYLTGILDNGCPEGQQRLEGFRQACRDRGIPDRDVEIISCTWRTEDGSRVAERWMLEGRKLPDAFISANDEMALGVIEALERHGARIPEDVIVTGFDNVASAELSSPRLSTVMRDNKALNYRAMETLMAKIKGEKERPAAVLPYSLICSESCGCSGPAKPEYIRNKYFHQTRFLKNFYQLQDRMAEEMFEADNMPELMGIVEKNERIFGCGSIYLCVNDYYYDNYDKKQWRHDSEAFGEQMVLATRGESRLTADRLHCYARFPAADLLPWEILTAGRFWVFYPLHYNTYSIGYLAMNGISEAAQLNLHESIFSFLEVAIENVRKKCLLKQLNTVLDDLYVRDALTGLYNRFGFRRFGPQIFERFLVETGGAQVLFIDMDDMKEINDRFGHERGDEAICAVARILREACRQEDFIMRYAGDEFVVVAPAGEKEIKQSIHQGVHRFNDSGVPYRLGVSIGVVDVPADNADTLENCVKTADQEMYEKKKVRKARKRQEEGQEG